MGIERGHRTLFPGTSKGSYGLRVPAIRRRHTARHLCGNDGEPASFLGVRAAGPSIALFGGLMTAFNMALTGLILWVMAYPGIAQETAVLRALYYLGFAIGGVGFSVPMGLLIAGLSVPAAFMKLLPKWLVVSGFALGIIGELSALNLVIPQALFLIPLTRFPGFIWLIAAGFALPASPRSVPRISERSAAGAAGLRVGS